MITIVLSWLLAAIGGAILSRMKSLGAGIRIICGMASALFFSLFLFGMAIIFLLFNAGLIL